MRPSEIERLLPAIFQRTGGEGTPLAALLEVMGALLQPAEDALDDLDRNFSARRAPDGFVPLLARWVDLDVPVTTGLGHFREAIARAVELSQWRGSLHGLQASLETATGPNTSANDTLA